MLHWKDILKVLSSVLHFVFRWFFFSPFFLFFADSNLFVVPLEFPYEVQHTNCHQNSVREGNGSRVASYLLTRLQPCCIQVNRLPIFWFLWISGKLVQMALHFVRFAICICTHPECDLYRLQLSCVGVPAFVVCLSGVQRSFGLVGKYKKKQFQIARPK